MAEVKHLSVYIARPAAEIYEYAVNPQHLPFWASGLASSEVIKEGEHFIASSPFGTVRVKFVERNPFGVLDHDVTLDSGLTIRNPLRVVPNEEGSEITFTLFRRPEMSDEEWQRDAATIENLQDAVSKGRFWRMLRVAGV